MVQRSQRERLSRPNVSWLSLFLTTGLLGLLFFPLFGEIRLADSWRELVTGEFSQRGVEVAVGSVAISPLEGLVAHDVTIYRDHAREQLLAQIDRLAVAVDWPRLLRRQLALETIDLRGADVRIPTGLPGIKVVELTGLHALVHIGQNQIRLARGNARFQNVEVSLRGTVLNPSNFAPPPPAEEKAEPGSSDHLDSFPFELGALLPSLRLGNPGSRVDVAFSGDLAKPESVALDVRGLLLEPGLSDFQARSARVDVRWANRKMEVRQLEIEDSAGRFTTTGVIRPDRSGVRLQVESRIDLLALARSVAKTQPHPFWKLEWLDQVTIGPQEVRLAFEMKEQRATLIGDLALGELSLRNANLVSVSTDFSTDFRRVMLRGLRLEHETGTAQVDVLVGGGEPTRVALTSSINPEILRPFLSGRARSSFDEFQFRDAPVVEFELEGRGMQLETFSGTGRARLGRMSFRGVPIREASAEISYAKGAFSYTNLWVERNEGFVSGSMVYDFANSEIRLEDLISTVDANECIVWVDPRIQKDLRMFRFRAPPTLKLNGYAQFGGRTGVDLKMDVDVPSGMEYDIAGQWLPVDSATARVHFSFGRMDVRELKARTLGGELEGTVFVSLLPTDRTFGGDLDLRNVDFAAFTRLYFNYDDSKGRMRARYRFTSQLDNQRAMEGDGTVLITDGNVFAIPVFGPLSALLGEILPGIGYSPAKRAAASFSVKEGVAETRDFEVQGAGFTMLGEGLLDFVDDEMDFNVRINARGVPGIVLFPVSKLFEYTSTSRLSNPQWRPKRFSLPPRSFRREPPVTTP
ncbi:MAG: AsmA-like C-terminal region-containing protein [Verrucomicrobiia bacterium]